MITAALINGQRTGVDLDSWDVSDLNGQPAFKEEDTVSANRADITSIESYYKFGTSAGLDDQQIHFRISSIVATLGGFNSIQTQQEKEIVASLCAADDLDIIVYYATNYTMGDLVAAKEKHAKRIGVYVKKLVDVARLRVDHPKTKEVVMLFLKDREQIDMFMAAIRDFLADYTFKFHLGTSYGDFIDGIMNYIERTGSWAGQGQGIDSYEYSDLHKQDWYNQNAVDPNNPTLQEQAAAHDFVRDLFRDEMVKILRDGIITE
jgi:hypothetical protein